jgi:mycoredoxin
MAEQIKIYGTNWCPDTFRARQYCDKHKIPFTFIDIDQNPDAVTLVKRLNKGFKSVPTIVFPDGSILVEPSNSELERKFNGSP